MSEAPKNVDSKVVAHFGLEWSHFDQSGVPPDELRKTFQRYFARFPWESLPKNAKGFDLGCGSGRWAQFCAARVAELHCIDPSGSALDVARRNLADHANCRFHLASVDAMPLADGSMDFGYSLGVLHHIPDTAGGLRHCTSKLKPNAPFLLYLYYAFDNRPFWFRAIWRCSDLARRAISRLPYPIKLVLCNLIALLVYLPFARIGRFAERAGMAAKNLPLWSYRDKSLYTLRTDAFDRFGTRLEHRFTRRQIEEMMISAGLERIEFNEEEPFWCAVGFKARKSLA
jgi:SAM-dependent methyltransferase